MQRLIISFESKHTFSYYFRGPSWSGS